MSDAISRATRQDIPDIAWLLASSFASFESQYTPAAFNTTIVGTAGLQDRWDEGPVWVARQADVLLGTVAAIPGKAYWCFPAWAALPDCFALLAIRVGAKPKPTLIKKPCGFPAAPHLFLHHSLGTINCSLTSRGCPP